MSVLNSISSLLGLICFIAIIWIAVGALRRGRILWGLGILFGPIIPAVIYLVYFWTFGPSRYHLYLIFAVGLLTPATATLYAVKFWDDVKNPFVVYMTSFVLTLGLGYYAFSASGGMEMLKASQNVARGIAQGDLTEADALKFMNSNLDMMESSGLSEEQQKKMEFMRGFLKKAEGGFSEQEQSDVQKDFKDLKNPSNTSQPIPKIHKPIPKEDKPLPANNKQPEQAESRQASLKRTPVVQSNADTKPEEPHGLQNQDSAPPITMIQFSPSGSDGQSVESDALAQTKEWLGRFVQVTPKKGVQQQGVLIEVSSKVLRLEKDMSAGFVTLPFNYDEIASIELVK